jgi:VIT1/CCC1 family predicted Fe2+/Mn2+ transporter
MKFKRVSHKKAFQVGAMTKHRRTPALADFILGSQDGMVNVLGIVLGVAIASQDLRLIYVSGLAATFAESVSMAAVAYTSSLARRDRYLALLEMEKLSLKERPENEPQEVRKILKGWGLKGRTWRPYMREW